MYALNRRTPRAAPLAARYLQNVHRGHRAFSRLFLGSSNPTLKIAIYDAPRRLSASYHLRRAISTNPTFDESPPIIRKVMESSPKTGPGTQEYRIYKVLEDGEPGPILKIMGDPENAQGVASLPDSVFVSALLRLTPEYFVEPFVSILQPVHEWHLTNKNLNTIDNVLEDFFESLNQIVYARLQNTSNSFGLVEYRHLLRISASIGDINTVTDIWKDMKSAGIEPDLQCYNSFLHACVWDSAVYSLPRYSLRVSRYYYRQRYQTEPLPEFRGFGTAQRSVRKQVNAMILDMQAAKLPLDEDTYINMFLASARVGSRAGMVQILRVIWGIDVVTITSTPYEDLPDAMPIAASSLVYPSHKLLLAIAHAFGCNSMFEEGLKTVHYVSEQYKIEITDNIWAELFERAFVLSRTRANSRAELRLGEIDPAVLDDIQKMLQLDGKTYDMNVYRMLATAAAARKQHVRFREILREAYSILRETRRKRNHALRLLGNYLGVSLGLPSYSSYSPIDEQDLSKKWSTPHVWRALRKYELLRLLAEQQQKLMEKMASIVSIQRNWTRTWDADWTHRNLPKYVAEWKEFLPESFQVLLPSGAGHIEFLGRTTWKSLNIRMHDYEPVRLSDCGGGFAAEEEEQDVEVSHDILWAHFIARFGDLTGQHPFRSFIRKAWVNPPAILQEVDERDYPVEDEEPSLETWQQNKTGPHAFYVTLEPIFTPVSL